MKKNYFYMLLAVSLMTTSCRNSVLEAPAAPDDAIKIVASIASRTRAPQYTDDGSGNFSQGDRMSLFIADEDENRTSVNYEYGSGILTWGSLGLEGSSAKVALATCYPSQAVTRSGTFEFNPLTASEADLLLASAQTVTAGTSEAVNLVFNHALHRLDLNFTPGNSYTDEDMKSFSICLQAKTTCVVDMMQGKIVGVKEDTGEYVSKETAASFYLVPQATTGIVMNITVGENTKSLTLSELLDQLSASQSDLSSGKFSKLTLKVSQQGITVEGGSINAWDNQVTADGEVVIG